MPFWGLRGKRALGAPPSRARLVLDIIPFLKPGCVGLSVTRWSGERRVVDLPGLTHVPQH